MNMQDIQGEWAAIKRGIKTQWSRLTEEEIESLRAGTTELADLLQEKYGLDREAAEEEVEAWQRRL